MNLVGVTGAIGHGKSTLADMLIALEPSAKHFESFQLIAGVVDALHKATVEIPSPTSVTSLNKWLRPLPSILEKALGQQFRFKQIKIDAEHMREHPIEYEKLLVHIKHLHENPDLLKQRITDENKSTYRPMLQWIGNYLPKKLDPGLWYTELLKRAEQAVDTGTRLCVIGGVRYPMDANIIQDAGGVVIKIYRPGIKAKELSDPTERERESIMVDTTIMNDGDLANLRALAKRLLFDLQKGKLQKSYKTSPTTD